MKKWKCTICNYIHEGESPPEACPICKAPASKFILMESDEGQKASPEKAARIKALEKELKDAKKAAEANKVRARRLYDMVTGLMAKHHAHPVSVHFPNGVLPVSVILFVLAFVFSTETLSIAGFYNLVFVLLTLPIVIFAGYVEWVKKYNRAVTFLFQTKITAATITFTTCLVNVIWYIINPEVLSSPRAWLFILSCVIMLASAGVAGHLGGKLVFKD